MEGGGCSLAALKALRLNRLARLARLLKLIRLARLARWGRLITKAKVGFMFYNHFGKNPELQSPPPC
jgi:hypothetical protein